jgi:DNA processing protein
MIEKIDFHIKELDDMKKYPQDIFYIGNKDLLNKPKISIVGTRKPSQYTKIVTSELSRKLSNLGVVIVSGGAMGVDAISHQNSIPNTIAVMANGLDIRYPAINKNLICDIENKALCISTYQNNSPAKPYTFVQRNELVVALGDVLIITQADLSSGSLRSAEYAIAMNKKIFVLPHRINESDGTNKLLKMGLARAIFDIDEFIQELGYGKDQAKQNDSFLDFCKSNPTYEEAVALYNSKVFEYELLGLITIKDGIITAC